MPYRNEFVNTEKSLHKYTVKCRVINPLPKYPIDKKISAAPESDKFCKGQKVKVYEKTLGGGILCTIEQR